MIRVQVVQHLIILLGQLIVIAAQVTLLVIRLKGEVSEFPVHFLYALSEINIVALEKLFGVVILHRLDIHQLLVVRKLSQSLFLLSSEQSPAGLLWVLKLVDIDNLRSNGVPEVFFEEIGLVKFMFFVYLLGFMFAAVTAQLLFGQHCNRVVNVCHLSVIVPSLINSSHAFSEAAYSQYSLRIIQ